MRGPREPEGLCVDQLGHELAQRCAWEVSLGAPVSQHFRSTVGDGSEDTSLAHVLTGENRQTDPPAKARSALAARGGTGEGPEAGVVGPFLLVHEERFAQKAFCSSHEIADLASRRSQLDRRASARTRNQTEVLHHLE